VSTLLETPLVCFLTGDGISTELNAFAARALRIAIPGALLEEAPAGFATFGAFGTALPAESLAAARRADACFLVAVGSPMVPTSGYRSPIVTLRCELDLFANIRPVQSLPQSGGKVDLVLVRENTEGMYAGRETTQPGRCVAERVITERASRRIARFAGQIAQKRSGRFTIVHKANVLRETCGLFRTTAFDELEKVGGLQVDELLVDNAALQLVANPERFDVLVTTNLFGDILSDVAAHAGGGLGLVTSANLGSPGQGGSLFEPVHGSAPDLVGTHRANPIATLRAMAMLVRHLGFEEEAQALEAAINHTIVHGPCTPDLGGEGTTASVSEAILARLYAHLSNSLSTDPS
jgi:homoisocitrate dehydrogenase